MILLLMFLYLGVTALGADTYLSEYYVDTGLP